MNAWLTWFSRLTWIGAAANLGFILPAIFAPDVLEALLGPGSTEFAIYWVPWAGFLLLSATLLYLPAAKDPLGLHVYAWLSVVGRGMAATYWLWSNSRWDLPGMIQTFWMLDGAFCVIFLILLQMGMPPELKISPANLARAVAGWGKAMTSLFSPADGESNGSLRAFGIVTWLAVVGNLGFALPALLNPEATQAIYQGVTAKWAYLWLGNCAFLLIQLSFYFLAAGAYPKRYRIFAWSSVVFWLFSSGFWFWLNNKWSPESLLSKFWIIDGALGVILLVLLHRGMPAEYQISAAGIKDLIVGWFQRIGKALMTPAHLVLLALVLVAGVVIAKNVHGHLLDIKPDPIFDDPAEQFKYGAIGLAIEARVPLYVWEVLPDLCGDTLPDPSKGMASLGLIYEDGKDLPIGFARRDLGYPTVEPNCSLCHTANYRTEEGAPQQIALGGSAHMLDLQAFQWFLYDCADSPQFTAKNVVAKIKEKRDLGAFESFLYRWVIIPTAKTGLDTQRKAYAWQKSRPDQGRGRTDTFNPTKITVLNLPDDGTIGTVDLPAIWNQRAREGMWLHWDGNNDAIKERNYAAAMAVGATPNSVLPDHFKIVTDFVLDLPPAKFPYDIDQEKASRGGIIYNAQCADCHAFGSQKIGTVTDIAEIGTDSHRLNSFTKELVEALHSVHEGLFQFDAYRKTEGYANVPIDGIWVRAPYLHNGSVPTLWDLLQKPEDRPKSFYRGYEVFDPVNVGFVHHGPEVEKVGWLQDSSEAGNGNGGHLYGTDLTDEEKWDLIEFLKTL